MELTDYFVEHEGAVSFTEAQASAFAKGIAGDFNPLHDPGSRRFCIPGDLLFCVLLNRYGIARTTAVQFSGMLDGDTQMHLPEEAGNREFIQDSQGKALLSLALEGDRFVQSDFISGLSEAYVKFSGQTFPDILVPLMRDAAVMINPDRPMVIYKDMAIELAKDFAQPLGPGSQISLELTSNDMSVNGRKAAVRLSFHIKQDGLSIGEGEKNMVLSGLRDFDEPAMQLVIQKYQQWRDSYQNDCSAPTVESIE